MDSAARDANSLTRELVELRQTVPPHNPFIEHIRSGRLNPDDLSQLIRNEFRAAETEISVYALGVLRYRHAVFHELSDMALSARTRLCSLRPMVDADQGSADDSTLRPDGFAYPGFLCWAALHCNRPEFGLVLYADLKKYGSDSRDIAGALETASIAVPQQIIQYYADSVPDGLSDKVLDFVQEGIERGADVSRAVRLARVMEECVGQQYWRAPVTPKANATEGNQK